MHSIRLLTVKKQNNNDFLTHSIIYQLNLQKKLNIQDEVKIEKSVNQILSNSFIEAVDEPGHVTAMNIDSFLALPNIFRKSW